MIKSQSFAPVIGQNPKVLILGTLPSTKSLDKQEYYGNPQNQFWSIIFAITQGNIHEEYKDKIDYCKQHGIALWDVCKEAVRPGSLDSAISQEQPNDIIELLAKNTTIETIAFNGQKAEKLFHKYLSAPTHIKVITLLSSSPANASYSFNQKKEQWQKSLPI